MPPSGLCEKKLRGSRVRGARARRSIVTRGDETDQSFSAMIHLAAAVIHSR